MMLRQCLICERIFTYDLGIHFKWCLICQACHSGQGPIAEAPRVADARSVEDPKMTLTHYQEVSI